MIPNVRGKRAVRHALFDANYWKSFIHARLAVSMADKGSLSLYGQDPSLHTLLAEHLTAEYRVKTEGRGRKVDEWKIRPEASDNHWLDGIVGAAVAASILGATLPGTGESGKPLKQRRHIDLAKTQKKLYTNRERKLLNPPQTRRRLS
jgi:hypothetical protein